MPPVAANLEQVLEDLESQFFLSTDALRDLTKAFLDEMHEGLSKYNFPMAMIPTFVRGVPNGSEKGTFLALDLGGTNLRVCEVILNGDTTFSLRQQKYKVSDTLKMGEATALFDYLADSVDAFLTDSGSLPTDSGIPPSLSSPLPPSLSASSTPQKPGTPLESDLIHLGLTFSFPVEQHDLDSGMLLTWTKGFAARNAIGKDVVRLLQDAFNRKHLHVKCVALVNDTVGAMLSRAYQSGGCILGAIFGTGTNGAYLEEVANITKLGNSPAAQAGGHMIVNTEWGAFNNSREHLPSTPFDNKLDRESINPRFQAFEKFISGMYLGEVTRNVLLHLLDAAPRPFIFDGRATPLLNKHYGLDTAVMSAVESAFEGTGAEKDSMAEDETAVLKDIGGAGWEKGLSERQRARLEHVKDAVVKQLGFAPEDVSLRDATVVWRVSGMVARRGAHLSGCAIAATIVQTGRGRLDGGKGTVDLGKKIGVGVDGSLVEFYPNFERLMRESLRALVGEEVESRVVIGMAKDGSGVGAALGALQAAKQLQAS